MQQVYSLAQVLDYKKRLEDREKENLAQADLSRQEQRQRLDTLLGVMEEQIVKSSSIHNIEHRGQYWNLQLQRIQQARRNLLTTELAYDAAQAKLLEAAVERKKFEIHRETEFLEKKQIYLQAEQKMLDECALQAFLRQRERK